MHRVCSEQIAEWAASQLARTTGLENEPNQLLHLYRNLAFTFVGHGYKSGRIETGKTRRGVREFLAQKKNKASFSGGRFNSFVRDLEMAGLVSLEGSLLVLNVPMGSVSVGEYGQVEKATRLVTLYGFLNLSDEALAKAGVSADDVVDAIYAIEQLLPNPTTKEQIRRKLKTILSENVAAAA